MFFFVNYEGIRQTTGQTNLRVIPDANALQGLIPTSAAPASGCLAAAPINGVAYSNCGPGSPNAGKFAVIQPYLNLYSPASLGSLPVVANLGNGTEQVQVNANSPGVEDYVVGRYDWTISTKDSIFARYLFDNATLTEPFYSNFPQWGNFDRTRNQFATIGEKHIFSNSVIDALNLGVSRTFLDLHSSGTAGDLLAFSGDLTTARGEPIMNGALNPGSGISSVGPGQISPVRYAQNKLTVGNDVFWNKGDHSLRIGGSVERIQTNGLHMFPGGGTWTFTTLGNFLADLPNSFQGPCNYYNNEPGCVFPNGTPYPQPSAQHDARETDFAMYVQDDWRVRPTLTLNLGLRYEPTTDPWDAFHQLYDLLPVPYGQTGNLPPALGAPLASTLTPVNNFMLKNDSLHNVDPRIGIAWDPFKDHKTSIRAGFGIFHAIMSYRDYRNAAYSNFPWVVKNQVGGSFNFPFPNQSAVNSPTTETNGTNPYNTTPYLQQWNLSVQREIMKNTVLTVAYVGSHGVHLLGEQDANPPVLAGGFTAAGTGAIQMNAGQTVWPTYPGEFAGMVSAPVFNSNGTVSAASPVAFNASGTVTCNAPAGGACSIANPNGQPVVDPATGQQVFSHIVQTGATSFSIASNNHVNPNFSYMNNGITNLWSRYNALQIGVVRRLTNNLSSQISYTYADCVDISSGDWTQEGGTIIADAYNYGVDRGPCLFMIRHNLTANFLYILPFQKGRLVSGWQVGGILYFATGGPFDATTFSNGSTDIGTVSNNRLDYTPAAPGCNNAPINSNYGNTNGISYLNPNCFAAPPVGELGNLGRNALFGPNNITFNPSLVKNTRISERFNLQFRAEFFNVFNRPNYANPGFPAFQQGASTNAGTVSSGSALPTFGQITSVIGTMRQIQFGLKLMF